jgi:DNA-binding IclR family transcriptional regulator
MARNERRDRSVKSVCRAMSIVEQIRESNGATVTELAEGNDLAKSTVHGYLATMHDEGYLTKNGSVYHVGTKFLRLGEHSRTRRQGYSMVAEKVSDVAERTDERAQFVTEEHGRGVFLYRKTGEHAVETNSGTGKRMYLHSTSAGKSILAHLPEKTVETIIEERGLPTVTDNTIADPETLFSELSEIRERGYAFNHEENIEGLHAVGAPLVLEEQGVIGALSISGPTHRMKGDWFTRELPDLLLGTVNELELNIAYR